MGWLPPFPYGCTTMRLLKRSRSDTAEVRLGPTLRSILGSRSNPFHSLPSCRVSACSALRDREDDLCVIISVEVGILATQGRPQQLTSTG